MYYVQVIFILFYRPQYADENYHVGGFHIKYVVMLPFPKLFTTARAYNFISQSTTVFRYNFICCKFICKLNLNFYPKAINYLLFFRVDINVTDVIAMLLPSR
jgi:hypothetical protein